MLQCLTFAESHLEVHQIILTGNFWEKGGGSRIRLGSDIGPPQIKSSFHVGQAGSVSR